MKNKKIEMKNKENQIVLERLRSRKEAAQFLGVTEHTLAVWACTGRYNLQVCKIGSRSMYDPEVLVKFKRDNSK